MRLIDEIEPIVITEEADNSHVLGSKTDSRTGLELKEAEDKPPKKCSKTVNGPIKAWTRSRSRAQRAERAGFQSKRLDRARGRRSVAPASQGS